MENKTINVSFFKSSSDVTQCPEPNKPEYAFIGRSNVGKSSLINMLCGRNKLAKISSKPGKTQLINHFIIDDNWYLVDLPGYGWAKASKQDKNKWSLMNAEYMEQRKNLACVFLLIDSRIDAQAIDIDFMNWAGEQGIPLVIVFTKTDKLSKNKIASNIARIKKAFLQHWEELPLCFQTSSETGAGREQLLSYIEELNDLFYRK